ncbi:uncharacterized protein LOC135496569 [Lineus longissimus]|uniref:uncharacterized protein LOC135496569 n=1 Tax=Lineus longissimus TaxID=88925 RepID=UPI00315C67E7
MAKFEYSGVCMGRWTALVVACLANLTAGSVFVFNVYSVPIKKIFQYSQSQVEVLSAMFVLGMDLLLPAGMLFDRFGPFWTSLVGFVTCTVGYGLIYAALLSREAFVGDCGLLSFYFFIAGHGTVYMYTAALMSAIVNFAENHRATVVAVLDTIFSLSIVVFITIYDGFFVNGHLYDEENQNVNGFVFFIWITMCVVSFLCVCFLRRYPSDYADLPVDNELHKLVPEKAKTYGDTDDIDQNYGEQDLARDQEFQFNSPDLNVGLSPDYVLPDLEEPPARPARSVLNEDDEDKSVIDSNILPRSEPACVDVILSINFQLLMWTFVLLASATVMFFNNLTTIARAVHMARYSWLLNVTFSLSGIVSRFICSPLSDYLFESIPRVTFLLFCNILSVVAYFMLMVGTEIFAVLYLSTFLIGMSIAALYTFIPTMLSEQFGIAHFGRHFGIFKIIGAAAQFATQASFGAMYDSQLEISRNVTNSLEEMDCLGESCIEGGMGLAEGLCIGSVLLSAMYLIRTKTNKYQPF